MPKWDKTRNYYADLELQPSASSDEIKRQFKKLALKYHPDRNPGREAEVNPKFQIIQSAHEILTDETLRRQYDEARRSHASRYPSASGVRGNPWQDTAKAYPPPPRRAPSSQARTTPGGAQRYEGFTGSMPRHARPHPPKDDPQFRRSTAEAWDNLRPNSTRKSAQARPATPGRAPTSAARDSRPGPAPVPPRTAYQKQKADASFGTSKKTGFTPRSPSVADEPPVTNKNYFTNRTHSNLFTVPDAMPEASSPDEGPSPTLDPFASFKDHFMDSRQRTPYHTPGGEKTSIFEGNPSLGRSTSTRTPPRAFNMPGAFPHARPRSSSPARSSSNDGGSEQSSSARPNPSRATNGNSSTTQTQASQQHEPQTSRATNIPPQPASASHAFTTGSATAQPNGGGPSVYAPQTLPAQFMSYSPTTTLRPDKSREHVDSAKHWPSNYGLPYPSSEEGIPHGFATLLPLEMQQRRTLDRLVGKYSKADQSSGGGWHVADGKPQHSAPHCTANDEDVDANSARVSSFNFPGGASTSGIDASYKPFMRNSTENINTRFVDHEMIDDWQFKAGSASANEATTPSKPRPQSRNRPSRWQTPSSKPPLPMRKPQAEEGPNETNANKQAFSAGAWTEQIGPEHFEPQSTHSTATSPARRPNLKKAKSFRSNTGTATVAGEENQGRQDVRSPSPSPVPMTPDAMDIDTPPTAKTEEIHRSAQVNNARKYSTEPHRADWRAGDVNGVGAKAENPTSSTDGTKEHFPGIHSAQPAAGATDHVPFHHGGSEDSEEFRTTFLDLKNVEPFMDPKPSGLKSFADLKSTLPFESRPSEHIPLEMKPPPGPLVFPPPPVAPRLPPTMGVAGIRPNTASFRKYAQDFNIYMEKWEAFNSKVLSHFTTRQEQFKLRRSQRGINWLEDGAPDYLTELNQDLDVQKKYAEACAEHQKRIMEFIDFRDRVK
ncbi:hypothetical protein F5Y14DRAFT_450191 [Nemania sp. NC0429]|nr:hypothetical protein F5Y14DRAFT_450191 [Nemania sp. NC0429]